MSRPPTPSPNSPVDRSEWRFHPIDAATEWIEDYRPGGLHPIHLGDTLDGGRYKILRKLGYGAFSTVWLARDAQESRYVAIKAGVARASETNNELAILQHLARHRDQGDPGASRVMELLHSFEHRGPNGHHTCLVFPVMGPSANTMVSKFRNRQTREQRYPLWIARSMLKQLLLALSFLHQNNVVHADIQPGNILFSLRNIDTLPEPDLQTDIAQPGKISDPVKRVDEKVDLWSPRYTAVPQPLTHLATVEPGFSIRISDMGGASLLFDPVTTTTIPITPAGLRPPELIIAKSWDASIDIWSFGCLLFEFLTGSPLFLVSTWGMTEEESDDDHLQQLISILGPLPEDLRAQWLRYSLYYSDDGTPIVAPEVETPPLEKLLESKAPPDMDAGEVRAVGVLLRWILQYDPARRPSAKNLLKDPWFEAIG